MSAAVSLDDDPGCRSVGEERQHLDALDQTDDDRRESMNLSLRTNGQDTVGHPYREPRKHGLVLERPLWREATIPSISLCQLVNQIFRHTEPEPFGIEISV